MKAEGLQTNYPSHSVMVYAGWINKTLVAALGARGCKAIGLSGADGFSIPAVKRNPHL